MLHQGKRWSGLMAQLCSLGSDEGCQGLEAQGKSAWCALGGQMCILAPCYHIKSLLRIRVLKGGLDAPLNIEHKLWTPPEEFGEKDSAVCTAC